MFFPNHKKRSALQLKELAKDRFIDKRTRKLEAIVSVFNANVRLFAVVTLTVEFGETGQLAPGMTLRSLRLESFVEPQDFFRLAMELIALLISLGYVGRWSGGLAWDLTESQPTADGCHGP